MITHWCNLDDISIITMIAYVRPCTGRTSFQYIVICIGPFVPSFLSFYFLYFSTSLNEVNIFASSSPANTLVQSMPSTLKQLWKQNTFPTKTFYSSIPFTWENKSIRIEKRSQTSNPSESHCFYRKPKGGLLEYKKRPDQAWTGNKRISSSIM